MAMAVVAGGMMLQVLNISIVNIALPSISHDFNSGVSGTGWVVTGYLVTQAVLLPIAGRAGDLFGRRRVWVAGILIMVLASVLCALAWSELALVVFRILQGVGASAMAPTAFAYAAILFPPEKRGLALGVLSGVMAIAPVVALNIAGVLVGVGGWRSVFWFTPVVAAIVLVGAVFVMRERPPVEHGPFDVLGAILAALGLFPLLIAVSQASYWGWAAPRTLAMALLGVVFLALFVWRERVAPDPMLDLSLLSLSTVRNSNITGFLVGAAMFGTLLVLPFYFSTVLGYSNVYLSLAITPVAVCFMIASPASGRLMSRYGSDTVVRVAVGTALIGSVVLGFGALAQSYVWMLPGLILAGVGLAAATAPVTTTAIHEAPQARLGVAASLPNVSRYAGGALGAALLGTVLAMSLPMSVTADEGLLAPALRTDAAHGMQRALLAAAALLLVGIVAAFRMPRVVGPGARIAAMVSGTDVPNARAPD
jgi:EmrB/QacA subfamily drug resistance transporter